MQCVAIDCEMVGIGPNGRHHMLARVSIVDETGALVLDKFVKPQQEVSDYRTHLSGVRPEDMASGEEFADVQRAVIEVLTHKILVGHSLANDMRVLFIRHPMAFVRDTAEVKDLTVRYLGNRHTPSLKVLAKAVLGIDIQAGEHSSIEDARAVMNIYQTFKDDWEAILGTKVSRCPWQYAITIVNPTKRVDFKSDATRNSEAYFRDMNEYFAEYSYIASYTPSKVDIATFDALVNVPLDRFVHLKRWYLHIKSFSQEERRVLCRTPRKTIKHVINNLNTLTPLF